VSASRLKSKKWIRRAAAGGAVLLLIVVGGPYVYIHFIEGPAPAPLSLSTTPTTALKAGEKRAALAGRWAITKNSVVRYRVKETLFGQGTTAVGTTSSVTGSLTIAGTKVTAASFSVDMTKITSDAFGRDGQFQGRIMNTANYPTANFVLTAPIALGTPPADGVISRYSGVGKLTLHGTTKSVTVVLTARRTANVISVQGNVPVAFSDYNIANPSGGPASVGDLGQIEFVLDFAPN
jgi:polyisoprenoid-binding protein YceI